MPCNPLTNLAGCLGSSAGGQASSTGTGAGTASGWDAICQSFAKAAQQLLTSFAKSFSSIPPIDLSYSGIRSVYGLSLEIAAVVAAVLLMVQVIRTAMTHDGSAIVQGLTGIGKAALAFVLILGAAATALRASDELTGWIITRTFGTPQALAARLGQLATFRGVSPSLLLVLALAGILLTLALWAQLLIRNIAVTVLVAVSPIAAAGQVAHSSQQWWRKLVRVTIQLIALKPAVALIFAIGLTLPGTSGGVEKLLTGLLVLLLAGIAWPAMARASAVFEVYLAGGSLSGIRGGDRGHGGSPAGVNPGELSRVAEARTMTAVHEAHARPGGTREQAPSSSRRPGLALDASSRTAGPQAARPQALGPGAAATSPPGPDGDRPAELPGGHVPEPAATNGAATSVPATSVPATSVPANGGAPASWRNP